MRLHIGDGWGALSSFITARSLKKVFVQKIEKVNELFSNTKNEIRNRGPGERKERRKEGNRKQGRKEKKETKKGGKDGRKRKRLKEVAELDLNSGSLHPV